MVRVGTQKLGRGQLGARLFQAGMFSIQWLFEGIAKLYTPPCPIQFLPAKSCSTL